jgi:peptide chain release factor subunit 1
MRVFSDSGDGRAAPSVLVLTPLKDAADCLDGYCQRLCNLSYPHERISLGFLESDSIDDTWMRLNDALPRVRADFRRVGVWRNHFGFRIPPGIPRWAPAFQLERRSVLAKSRNRLLMHALDDEDWVLWLDVDVVKYPSDLLEQLLAAGEDIVQAHCVLEYGGPTFDTSGWRDHGRLHLDDLRPEGQLVELDAVGGTVLLVRADAHRDGLVFPPFLYGRASSLVRTGRRDEIEGEIEGEIETEGLGIMARDMGYHCWGMPRLEVLHRMEWPGPHDPAEVGWLVAHARQALDRLNVEIVEQTPRYALMRSDCRMAMEWLESAATAARRHSFDEAAEGTIPAALDQTRQIAALLVSGPLMQSGPNEAIAAMATELTGRLATIECSLSSS